MPLEDVLEVESTDWKWVAIAIVLVVLGGVATLAPFPYGWLIGLGVGVVLLFVGTKLKRNPLVKTFSRTITSDALIVSDQLEAEVIRAGEKRDP